MPNGEGTAVVEPGPVDLSALDAVLAPFAGSRPPIIPVLQRAQDAFGYLPREVLHALSRRARIPLAELFGVATFYAQFRLKKRGRHLVRVCDGTACHVRGAPRNMAAIEHALHVAPGHTSADHKLSVEIVYCLGSCGLAPIAVVGDKVLGRLGPEELVAYLTRLS